MDMQVLTVSTKGQVSIPKDFREKLGIEQGDILIAALSDNTIVIKKQEKPTWEQLEPIFKKAQAWAKEVGLTEKDLEKTIKEVRSEQKW